MDGVVRVWRIDGDRSVFRRLESRGGPVWSLAFSQDGTRLYSATGDGIVRAWDVGGGVEIRPAEPHMAAAGHRAIDAPAPASDHPGAKLFRKCAACHTTTPDGAFRAGPTLFGLFGRRAGTVRAYPYSDVLRDSNIVWSAETVDALFAVGPDELIPGSKMPLQRIPSAADRAALVDYLERITRPNPRPLDPPGKAR